MAPPGRGHSSRSGWELIGGGVLALPPSAGLQAVAVAVHLEDVDVVGEPVEQGSGQALRAEAVMIPHSSSDWCVARGRGARRARDPIA